MNNRNNIKSDPFGLLEGAFHTADIKTKSDAEELKPAQQDEESLARLLGFLGFAALYTIGLLYFATPLVLSYLVPIGIYATTIATILATSYVALSLAIGVGSFIIFSPSGLMELMSKDLFKGHLMAGVLSGLAIVGASAFGIYEMTSPLFAALTATNPLVPLITLGFLASYAVADLTAEISKAFKAVFFPKNVKNEMRPDDTHQNMMTHKNSHDYIHHLLPKNVHQMPNPRKNSFEQEQQDVPEPMQNAPIIDELNADDQENNFEEIQTGFQFRNH